MSNWAIRDAIAVDADSMAAIDKLVSPRPWSAKQFGAACDASIPSAEQALVVVVEARVQAFLVYARMLDEVSIYNIAVHPVWQGEGVGRALLETLLQRSVLSGGRRCLLEVRRSNTPARKLYSRLQFQVDAVRKDYYTTSSGREDALLMSRQL